MAAAFIAPAFPAMSRITERDIHRIDGVPVDQTEASLDPRSPVRDARISRCVAAGSRHRVAHIGLPDLEAGGDHLKQRIGALLKDGFRHIAFDATRQAHLDRIPSAARFDFPNILPVGSTGLASSLALTLPEPERDKRPQFQKSADSTLFVCGSATEVLRIQASNLASRHAMPHDILDASALCRNTPLHGMQSRIDGLASQWKKGLVISISAF